MNLATQHVVNTASERRTLFPKLFISPEKLKPRFRGFWNHLLGFISTEIQVVW